MHQDFIQIFPISATKSQLNTNNNNWTNHNCLVQNFETIFIRDNLGDYRWWDCEGLKMLSGSFFYSGDQKFYKPRKFKVKVWDL